MKAILVIFLVALCLVGIICFALVWAVNNEQYEDLDREAARILDED